MLTIPYESSNFGPSMGPLFQGVNNLSCTWEEIIWAAITVGRKNWSHVIRFGEYSRFEILYRLSIVYANLQQENNSLIRSHAYINLDPSEKSAISYFLGLTSAKLFAAKLLNVFWLMHIEKYQNIHQMQFWNGRSRPDLFGPNNRREWVVIEAKGRSNRFDSQTLEKAKYQVRMLRTIAGQFPVLRVALESHFRNSTFQVFWKDPEGFDENSFDLNIQLCNFIYDYYLPFIVLFNDNKVDVNTINAYQRKYDVVNIYEADIKIGLDAKLRSLFQESPIDEKQAGQVMEVIFNLPEPVSDGQLMIGGDGILVSLGRSWDEEKMKLEPVKRAHKE
ncbi:hypothetical protein [Desulfoscipio geothermicus]|uniref:Uncharacterized protein n=1 Tax=Desulfoscipio geothermicus DSM 3669 TaxID=1121426 RepID=A0A1I6CUJ9_9FIRM|nr:hypothetical protein [Desulfoscipio geothermicus]SFQ96895.1 hypothetical protein SAMN05660706_10280 [Desulfoscipio geothermicus DSM 3669]